MKNDDVDILLEMKDENRNQMLHSIDKDGIYIKQTLKLLKKGIDLESAKIQAMDYANEEIDQRESLNGYNDKNDGLTKSNTFKKMNNLDCSFEDVSNYVAVSKHAPETKAFTSVSYSDFKKTATKSASKLKAKKEADDCNTIFNMGNSDESIFDNLGDSIPKMPDLSLDFFTTGVGKLMDKAGEAAADKLSTLADDAYNAIKGGLCARMSSDYIGGKIGDLIDKEYKENIADDGLLKGTSLDNLTKESGQNNFTYKILKNQYGQSNSKLLKAADITRDDQQQRSDELVNSNVNDFLKDLEKEMFE